jgi:hypothetical protein
MPLVAADYKILDFPRFNGSTPAMKFKKALPIMCASAFLTFVLSTSAAEDGKVIQPFNGKDLSGWKAKSEGSVKSQWVVGNAKLDPSNRKKFVVNPSGRQLINNTEGHGKSLDLYSTELHGDAVITLEVMVPEKSNSGIYVMGEYEIQVLDSHGKDANPGPGDMGAIYGAKPPKSPKYLAPGEWNKYEIHWQAPKFDAQGKKTANAKFLKVILNGAIIHENLEMPGPTPQGVDGKEKAMGPLMFQGNHGPVAYRRIVIKPL